MKPSEIYLRLWCEKCGQPPEDFKIYADAYVAILRREEAEAAFKASVAQLQAMPVSKVDQTPEDEVKAADLSAVRAEAGRTGMITRKRNALEGMERLLARGVTRQQLADAADLTITDIMDALDRKPMSLPNLSRIEKGLKMLEETAGRSGGSLTSVSTGSRMEG